VYLTYKAAEAEKLLSRHADGALVLGCDTESRPVGFGGSGRVALLQLATPTAVVLLPLLSLGGQSAVLERMLSRAVTVLVGVGVHEDAALLARNTAASAAPAAAAAGATTVDVATAAARCGIAPTAGSSLGLAALVECLGGPALLKSRSVTLSNWERTPLSETQVTYAALDAYASGWAAAQLHALASARATVAGAPPLPPLPAWLAAEAALQAAETEARRVRIALVKAAVMAALAAQPGGMPKRVLVAQVVAQLPQVKDAHVSNALLKLIKRGILARVSSPSRAPTDGSDGGNWVALRSPRQR
jgi:RNA polymerase sigma factor for flagellar operon FliA